MNLRIKFFEKKIKRVEHDLWILDKDPMSI